MTWLVRTLPYIEQGIDYAARSYHSGGVNVGLADGSVRFVSNGIDIQNWQALASITGGEEIADY